MEGIGGFILKDLRVLQLIYLNELGLFSSVVWSMVLVTPRL